MPGKLTGGKKGIFLGVKMEIRGGMHKEFMSSENILRTLGNHFLNVREKKSEYARREDGT